MSKKLLTHAKGKVPVVEKKSDIPDTPTIFPVRQKIVSVSNAKSEHDTDIEMIKSSDKFDTVIIRSSYATPVGMSEKELICEAPISKVADAMVAEHEKELQSISSQIYLAKIRSEEKCDKAIMERRANRMNKATPQHAAASDRVLSAAATPEGKSSNAIQGLHEKKFKSTRLNFDLDDARVGRGKYLSRIAYAFGIFFVLFIIYAMMFSKTRGKQMPLIV